MAAELCAPVQVGLAAAPPPYFPGRGALMEPSVSKPAVHSSPQPIEARPSLVCKSGLRSRWRLSSRSPPEVAARSKISKTALQGTLFYSRVLPPVSVRREQENHSHAVTLIGPRPKDTRERTGGQEVSLSTARPVKSSETNGATLSLNALRLSRGSGSFIIRQQYEGEHCCFSYFPSNS